jgi:hypothetical protein
MPLPARRPWLPRLFFRVNLGLAGVLILLVILSPLADNGVEQPAGPARLVALFARDGAVRRTAVAGAIGLSVTAGIFFRTPGGRRWTLRRLPPTPPANVVGA